MKTQYQTKPTVAARVKGGLIQVELTGFDIPETLTQETHLMVARVTRRALSGHKARPEDFLMAGVVLGMDGAEMLQESITAAAESLKK